MGIRALSLFSGAGGLDLAAKWVGIKTVCYVEYDPTAQAALLTRMRSGDLDDAPIFEDVRTFRGTSLRGNIDVVFGGFPCQPHSVAGKRGGRLMIETSGPIRSESYAKREHGDSSERTCGELFSTDTYSTSWQTLKEKASRLRPTVSILAPLVDHTHGPECSLWPTILASDGEAWTKSRKGSVQESISKVLVREEGPRQLRFIYLGQWISLGPLRCVEFAEWMMGWPKGWTACDSAVMEWTHMLHSQHFKDS